MARVARGFLWLIDLLAALALLVLLALLLALLFLLTIGAWLFPIAALADLIAGPVRSTHGFIHWWVSPSQGWLVARCGFTAISVLALVIAPGYLTEVDLSDVSGLKVGSLVLGIFLLGVVVLVCLFAATDLQAAHDHAVGLSQCFAAGPAAAGGSIPGVLHSSDALYFTIGNLTTAGTGQVTPLSSSCRALVAWQTAIGTIVVLFGVGAVIAHMMRTDTTKSSAKKAQSGREEPGAEDPPVAG
jgi:hypothetical protein